jgi:hypothetical protein
MRVRLLLLAVIACGALASSGCAARRPGGRGEFAALMKSWQGHTIDDLFRTWGRPVYLYSDGDGGRIAVYVPIASAGTIEQRESGPLRVYDSRMTDAWPIFRIFFADKTGRIVRSEWNGQWECCSR